MLNLEDDVLSGSVLLDVRRAFNSRAKHARLPTEVWEHIWRLLPLVDRVSVSQVCFFWRTIVLASLWLWAELDIGYCKAHPTFPACVKCRCHTDDVASPDVNLLPFVLPRSKGLPLSLRFRSTESTRRRLLDLLAGATHRLTCVEIDAVPGPNAGDSHLAHFCSMRSIRTLLLNRLSNGWDYFRPDNFDLPNLELLHISCGTIPGGVQAPLPNLTSLHFSFSTLDEILKYLKPQLPELSLDAGDVEKPDLNHWTDAESDEIRWSVANLSRIRVISILPTDRAPKLPGLLAAVDAHGKRRIIMAPSRCLPLRLRLTFPSPTHCPSTTLSSSSSYILSRGAPPPNRLRSTFAIRCTSPPPARVHC